MSMGLEHQVVKRLDSELYTERALCCSYLSLYVLRCELISVCF